MTLNIIKSFAPGPETRAKHDRNKSLSNRAKEINDRLNMALKYEHLYNTVRHG